MMPISEISAIEASLRAYCETAGFLGWDPWDALSSPLFRRFPFNHRLPRWAANHLIKIAPVNVRPLLSIKKDCFAKGLALFISGYCYQYQHEPDAVIGKTISGLLKRLDQKAISGYSGICWGTNVAYQTRAFFVPEDTPSAVHTAFAVEALLDWNELKPDPELIDKSVSACQFILKDLKITEVPEGIHFSYTPLDDTRVINVTALIARMLARTGKAINDRDLLDKAATAASYVVSRQSPDGSWPYGEDPVHRWIDNYHTGFVLEALEDYATLTGDTSVQDAVGKGTAYYFNQLFLPDGTPKFAPQSIYPIDGHCLAQGILTLTRLRHYNRDYLPFAIKIARWGRQHFQDDKGYFYFQKRNIWMNRIPHIRWVQAWMFLALNRLIAALREETS